MKRPIVDHWWSKIAETDSRGRAAAQDKLEEVSELSRKIAQSEGSEVAVNVLDNGYIELALLRCRQFHDRERDLTLDDLHIYLGYATSAMIKSQEIIDTELSYLDL